MCMYYMKPIHILLAIPCLVFQVLLKQYPSLLAQLYMDTPTPIYTKTFQVTRAPNPTTMMAEIIPTGMYHISGLLMQLPIIFIKNALLCKICLYYLCCFSMCCSPAGRCLCTRALYLHSPIIAAQCCTALGTAHTTQSNS